MKCLPVIAFAVLAVLVTVDVRGQEPSAAPPEMKVLRRLVGTWEVLHINKVAKWTPKETRLTNTSKKQLILGGRFVRAEGGFDAEGKPTNMEMFTYDPDKRTYLWWYFDAQGNASESTGTWDESSQTLTFRAKPGSRLTGVMTYRFLDETTFDWEIVAKDPGGEVGFHMEGKAVRQN